MEANPDPSSSWPRASTATIQWDEGSRDSAAPGRSSTSRPIYDLDLPTVRAFAPNVWDVPELLSIRAELKETDPYERTWWSRFMGDPRPVGGDVGPGRRYPALPAFPGFRDAIGFDLSFTKNRRSDWSAIVVGRVMYGILYVREIHRFRAELPEAIASIRNAWDLYGRCPVYSYMSGPEVSVAKMMAQAQMPINYMKASAPKFVRARRTIDAHNAGRVLYPEHNPTIAGTLARLQNFKGVEDDEDDEVDATRVALGGRGVRRERAVTAEGGGVDFLERCVALRSVAGRAPRCDAQRW